MNHCVYMCMYIHVHNYGAQSGQVVELASYYMYTLSQLAGWLHPYKYCIFFSQGERGTHTHLQQAY